MQSNLFILDKRSFKYIAYSVAALILFSLLDLEILSAVAFIFIIFTLYVFRNPEKALSSHEENSFVSPVDGKVLKIEEIEDERYGYRIEIESGYLDLSILRVPVDATVRNVEIFRGARLAKNSKLSRELNEYSVLEMVDADEHHIKIIHRLGRSFAPLYIDIAKEQEIRKASRYGVMLSGITTVYLPKAFKINVNRAEKVSASETLLGYFL